MDRPLEERLRRATHLPGTPIELDDGSTWTLPACPLAGPIEEQVTALLAEYGEIAERDDRPDDAAGIQAELRRENAIAWHLALALFPLNYPDIRPEHLQGIITRKHVVPITRAAAGAARLDELVQLLGGSKPAAEGDNADPTQASS